MPVRGMRFRPPSQKLARLVLEAEHPLMPLASPLYARGLLGCGGRHAIRKFDVGKGTGLPFAGEDQRVVGPVHGGRCVEVARFARR